MIFSIKQQISFCIRVGIFLFLPFTTSFAGGSSPNLQDTLFFFSEITGLPVEQVILTTPSETYSSGSNNWICNPFEWSLPIDVSAPNFKTLLLDSIPENRQVVLIPVIYPAKKIIIRENAIEKKLNSPVNTFLITQNYLHSATSTRQLIEKFPGVIVRSYGGKAGVSTLSVHGGQSHRFVVQFDGVPINNEQNGGADISTLPSFLISQMEYLPQGHSSRFGPSAMTGILQVSPTVNKTKVQIGTGNLGQRSIGLLTRLSPGNSSLAIGLGYSQFNAEYTYIEKGKYSSVPYQQGMEFSGLTNYLHQKFFYSQLRWPELSQINTSISLFHVANQRNLSTNVYATPLLNQEMSDSLTVFSLRFHLKEMQINFTGKKNQIRYLSDHHSITTKHVEIIYPLKGVEIRYSLNNLLNQSTRTLDTTTTRHALSALYTLQILPFQFSTSIRTEWERQQPAVGSIDAVIKTENDIGSHSLTFSQNYKKPNFNDLFWEPFGNPNLQTEYSSNLYYQYATLQSWGHFRAGTHFIHFQDLINWRPMTGSNAYWIPENISSALSYGFDLWVKKKFFTHFILTSVYSFSLTENYNKSLEEVHQGKSILYTPINSASVDVRKKLKKGEIGASFTFTGERLYRYNWPQDNILPSHLLSNLHYLHNINTINFFELDAIFTIENLFDTQYHNIYGFPDPGRSITFTLTLNERK